MSHMNIDTKINRRQRSQIQEHEEITNHKQEKLIPERQCCFYMRIIIYKLYVFN